MRNLLKSALLSGALLAATSVLAQNAPEAAPATAENPGSVDVAVMYGALHSGSLGGNGFWMQGGSVQAAVHFPQAWSALVDVSAEHTSAINGSGVGLDMVTTTFGPRYTWQPVRHGRAALYGQALAGFATGFHSVFPSSGGASSSTTDFALKVGGGLNYQLSRRVSIRVLEADWLRTQLPNAGSNVQNNLQLRTGVIVHFR